MQGDLVQPIKEHRDDILITVLLLVAALFVCGVPTLILSAVCCSWLERQRTKRDYLLFALCGALGLAVTAGSITRILGYYEAIYRGVGVLLAGVVVPDWYPPVQPSVSASYLTLSFLTVPLAPALGGAMDRFKKLQKALRLYQTTDEWLEHSRQREEERQRNLELLARRRAGTEPKVKQKELYIGTLMSGDSLPTTERESIGIHQRGSWITLEDRVLNEHMFLLGQTGAGKSTALVRLCAEILAGTERDVIVIDGKGEEQLAQDIRSLVWLTPSRGYETPIFRLGGRSEGAAYNGFRGTPQTILNRLLYMVGVQDAKGDSEFYADINRDLLQLMCYARQGPPRSFTELRQRCTLAWFQETYHDDPNERDLVMSLREEVINGLATRLRPLVREFGRTVNDSGFALEETRSAIFSLNALSVGDSAKRFCKFFIEDMKDFVSVRASRPGVLIIDEFGVFGNENIRDLLSLARSKEWGIILATQDYANLGEENLARQIIANTITTILLGTKYPEELGALAGTKLQIESSVQSDELGPTGMMSGRIQHAFKVDMNVVRRFQRGQSFVIRSGYAVAVQVAPMKLTDEEKALVPAETGYTVGAKQPSTVSDAHSTSAVEAGVGQEEHRGVQPASQEADASEETNEQEQQKGKKARGKLKLR